MSLKSSKRQRFPVMDELDLKVGISSVTPVKEFRFITIVILGIQWAAAAVNYSKFGVDNALTNGLQIKYNGILILSEGIKSINSLADMAYDLRIDSDGQATPQHHMISRLSFSKIIGKEEGLWIGADRKFSIEVRDDLSSSSNIHIHASLQGWYIP